MKTLMRDILRVCPSANPNDGEKVALVPRPSWSFSREERFALSLYSNRYEHCHGKETHLCSSETKN